MLKRILGLLSVLSFAVVLPAAADVKVRCDSTDGHYHECSAGPAEYVTIARQWSKTKCVRGDNWGYRDGMIWVDEGCRADFNVVPLGMTSSGSYDNNRRPSRMATQTVVCESLDGHRRHCSADTSGGVRITKRLSKSACDFKNDWGYDQNGVWVANGCRAEFQVRSNNRMVSQSMADDVLVCESENGRRKVCPANTRFGVTVNRQLSDSECIYGRTWGYDSTGIWVTSGCRAEFMLNSR
jgi:hypothetical protein